MFDGRKFKGLESTQTDATIATRTRSKMHQQDTASKCMVANEAPHQLQFAMEIKEQFLKLNQQADKRHIELSSKIQIICDQQRIFSEQQASIILELRKELAALRVQKGSENAPIADQLVKPKQNVKLLAPQSEATTKQIGQIHHNVSIGPEEPDLNPSSPSTSKFTKILDKQASAKPDSSKPRLTSTSETNERTVRISPQSLSKISTKQTISLGVSKHSSTSDETERKGHNLSNSSSSSDVIAATKATCTRHFALTSRVIRKVDKAATNATCTRHFALTSRVIRKVDKQNFPEKPDDTSSDQSSEEQDTSGNYVQQHERISFRVPSAPKNERQAAHQRMMDALEQASTKVSKTRSHERKRCDLYVGNLHFKSTCDDLLNAISPSFRKIRIEDISIPQGKGRNRGYGFITLSWTRDTPIDPEDICTTLSGILKVNSRPIYLCKAQDKTRNGNHDTSTTSEPSASSDCSESHHDTSTASQDASDHLESEYDPSTAVQDVSYCCNCSVSSSDFASEAKDYKAFLASCVISRSSW
jgi:RNA recognition motif-containing protein